MSSEVAQKVKKFFESYPHHSFEKGRILVHAGESPPGVIYLISGQVREYDINASGEEIVVNVFKPGAFFPMSWAINKTPNQYFFESATAVSARQAPADEAVKFLRANPDVTFDLLSRVYSGTDGLLRRMAHLMGGDAKTRLLFELLVEGKRFGEKRAKGILIAMHEDELARRAGLSRETISRELSKISSLGLVKVSRQGIYIKNMKKLETELGEKI